MRKLNCFNIAAAVHVLFILPIFAWAGGQGSGGGDPMAAQFMVLAKKLSVYYSENPFGLKIAFKPDEFAAHVRAMDQSLKDPEARHLIEFTSDKLYDGKNTEKPATFELNKPSDQSQIRVNRDAWRAFTDEQRLTNITQEILGILKVKNRYEIAINLVRDKSAMILAIPLIDNNDFKKPGWRIVGQDPDQFGRLTEKDLIIDGGTLGLNSKSNQWLLKFLEGPDFNSELTRNLISAWQHDRPAFMILNSPDGNNASITAFAPVTIRSNGTISAWQAYSLFFTRYRPVFQGPCVGAASDLTALQRLKNCYLDLSQYSSIDSLVQKTLPENFNQAQWNSLFTGLRENLLNLYAFDRDRMKDVLREYFIMDYSLVTPANVSSVRMASLSAHGLTPSFEGPFDRVSFWTKSTSQNPKAIRLYEAAKILAQENLVYLDANTRCKNIPNSPTLVSHETYNKFVKNGDCYFTRMGLGFPEPLYEAMVEAGFYYDSAIKRWNRDNQNQEAKK